MRVAVLSYTPDAVRLIAAASKVSLSKKTVEAILSMSDDEVEEWIVETLRRNHLSPWEHASYTFIIDGLSRVASHQLVRHRVASYTQMSHRYTEGYLRAAALEASRRMGVECKAESEREVFSCYSATLRAAAERGDIEVADIAFVRPPIRDASLWARGVLSTASLYYELLASGARREDARYVLADGVRTRIVVTMNARELIQVFFPLRMCTKAQWEIRRIAWTLWHELMKIHPQLWRYAGPSCVFRENAQRQRPAELKDFLESRERFTIPRCPELVEREAIAGCLKVASQGRLE